MTLISILTLQKSCPFKERSYAEGVSVTKQDKTKVITAFSQHDTIIFFHPVTCQND